MHPAAFDWSRATLVSRRNLPHVRQADAVYFVTYRTADSVPSDVVLRWKEQIACGGTAQHSLELTRRVEKYLDAPQGECPLAVPEYCQIVRDNLLHNDRKRYLLDAYAVMPNHVHVLIMPAPGESLTRIVADWKRYTARMLNAMRHTTGELWAAEMFDHVVRDLAALHRFRRYIAANPVKIPHMHTRVGQGAFAEVTGL